MTDVSSTGSTTYTQQTSGTDETNQVQLKNDFSEMSVEDIMFLVLTKRAEEQKKNIESFAAQVQANTLKATNYNNVKAAIDEAAKNKDGVKAGDDISVTWENANGSTESISLGEAMDRLGYSSSTADKFTAVEKDQQAVDTDKAQTQTDLDQSTMGQDRKNLAIALEGGSFGRSLGNNMTVEESSQYLRDHSDIYTPEITDKTVRSDVEQYQTDEAKLESDSGVKISQNDLETLSANLANAHDKIEGDNQIAMAQLQKDMDDYQTTLQTCSSSTTSMAQLAQKIGGTVGQ